MLATVTLAFLIHLNFIFNERLPFSQLCLIAGHAHSSNTKNCGAASAFIHGCFTGAIIFDSYRFWWLDSGTSRLIQRALNWIHRRMGLQPDCSWGWGGPTQVACACILPFQSPSFFSLHALEVPCLPTMGSVTVSSSGLAFLLQFPNCRQARSLPLHSPLFSPLHIAMSHHHLRSKITVQSHASFLTWLLHDFIVDRLSCVTVCTQTCYC